jgi:hypothetical protein
MHMGLVKLLTLSGLGVRGTARPPAATATWINRIRIASMAGADTDCGLAQAVFGQGDNWQD